jgi:sortase A
LAYCAFVMIDSRITQARLARSLQHAAPQLTTQPSTVPATVAAQPPAPASNLPANGVVGRLEIPRVGVSAMIEEGVGSRTLRVALGHLPGTPWPGQVGNVAIAGHRDTFFRPLRNIEINDEISLDTPGHNYHYRVSSTEVVDPHDVAVLKARHKDELTLITCYPFSYIGPAPKRFIVHAELAE